MKKLQNLTSLFLIIFGVLFITSITSCSSDDNSSDQATIVGQWNLIDFNQQIETTMDFNGVPIPLTIENEGQGDNCVYNFTENPNILSITGKVNVESKVYTYNQLVDTDNTTFNYDDYDFNNISWEITNNNEIVFSDTPFSISGLNVVSNDVEYRITTLTANNLTISVSGTMNVLNPATNQIDEYSLEGETNFER